MKTKLLLLAGVLLLCFLFASLFGKLYSFIFSLPTGFGSFLVSSSWYNFFDGVLPSYTFFLTLLFTAFGGEKKYWWLGILLIPATAFEVYFDLAHIYFPLALGLAGWALGLAAGKLIKVLRSAHGNSY